MKDLMEAYEEARFGKEAATVSKKTGLEVAKLLAARGPDAPVLNFSDVEKAIRSALPKPKVPQPKGPAFSAKATHELSDLFSAPQVEKELLGGKNRAEVLDILEGAFRGARKPSPKKATPTIMKRLLGKSKEELGSLIRNAKILRALKRMWPVAAAVGIPAAGYTALKGLDALTAKRAADDSRSLLTRVADHFAMSKLTPENRKLRDTIEESIRDEKRLRARAKAQIAAAKERLNEPASTGGLSWITDLLRSVVPGLAPVASPKDDGIVKGAVDDADFDVGPSTIGTLAHLGTLGTGAGLGAGIQSGAFGGQRAAEIAAKQLPIKLRGTLGNIAEEAVGAPAGLADFLRGLRPKELALLSQGEGLHKRILGPIADLITHRTVSSQREQLMQQLLAATGGSKRLREGVLTKLKKLVSDAAGKAKTAPGWKLGAGIGAAATLPFVLWNLVRARRVRAQGGPAASAARARAEALIAQANKLRKARKPLLAGLPQ